MFDLGADAFVGEKEPLKISAQGQPILPKEDELSAVADFLQDRSLFVELDSALVHIIETSQLARFDRAFGGLNLAQDDFQERGFAKPVPASDAEALAGREIKIQPGEELLAAQFHSHVYQFADP